MKNIFMNIVLFEPEIPQNTGNIGRLCVGTGSKLHLIEPLGFKLTDKEIKRAGLDYWKKLNYERYDSMDAFFQRNKGINFYFTSTKAKTPFYKIKYFQNDFIFFGKESAGLPDLFHKIHTNKGIKVPMSNDIRSMNVCNTVAVVLYEAIRQLDYDPDVKQK